MTTVDRISSAGPDAAQRRTKRLSRIAARALAPLIVIVIGGCTESPEESPPINTGVLSITPAAHTLSVGDSATFRIEHSPPGESTIATCNSSDTTVVITRRRPANCDVFAVAPGGATIAAFISTGQGIAAWVTVVAR